MIRYNKEFFPPNCYENDTEILIAIEKNKNDLRLTSPFNSSITFKIRDDPLLFTFLSQPIIPLLHKLMKAESHRISLLELDDVVTDETTYYMILSRFKFLIRQLRKMCTY